MTVRLTGRDEGDQCRATDLSDQDITISSYIPHMATLLTQSPHSQPFQRFVFSGKIEIDCC